MIKTSEVAYEVDGKTFTGFLYDGSNGRKVPGVLVVHEGGGMTGHPKERARMLAELGYVAFACDMFGVPITSIEQARATYMALVGDVPQWRKRALKGLDIVRTHASVDPKRLAAIGFCFGGSVVLELARDGADLRAVVSFHGVLATIAPALPGKVKASVLVLTGASDPLAPPEHVAAFENEMRAAGARDWQVVTYGNTHHAFTNPAADGSFLSGTLYNEQSDRRSWAAMTGFLEEIL